MLVLRHYSRRCSYYTYPSYSALLSLAVIRPARVSLLAPAPNTYSNIYYPAAVSVANMSASVAIPQQPHSQHPPASEENTRSAFPSRTSSSSRASSRSGRRSRNSTDEKAKPQSRMSAYFPLGYKEAASQWVRSAPTMASHAPQHHLLLTFYPSTVEQPLSSRLRARCP